MALTEASGCAAAPPLPAALPAPNNTSSPSLRLSGSTKDSGQFAANKAPTNATRITHVANAPPASHAKAPTTASDATTAFLAIAGTPQSPRRTEKSMGTLLAEAVSGRPVKPPTTAKNTDTSIAGRLDAQPSIALTVRRIRGVMLSAQLADGCTAGAFRGVPGGRSVGGPAADIS